MDPEEKKLRAKEQRRAYYYRMNYGITVEEAVELRLRVTECQSVVGLPIQRTGLSALITITPAARYVDFYVSLAISD